MAEVKSGFFNRLRSGLSKTRSNLTEGLGSVLLGEKKIDVHLLDEIETRLLLADVGIEVSQQIIDSLTRSISRSQLSDSESLYAELQMQLYQVLEG